MKNEYFKKPRQILAIAKANPYLWHDCGTFTASPSSAPMESLRSNKRRSSTDKDTMVGSKDPRWSRDTLILRERSLRMRGRAAQLNFTHRSFSFTLIDPTTRRCVCARACVWRDSRQCLPVSDPVAFSFLQSSLLVFLVSCPLVCAVLWLRFLLFGQQLVSG